MSKSGASVAMASTQRALISHLRVIAFFTFALTLGTVETDFFVVLLEGGKILTSFGEFTFFHTFTNIPVNECALGVHEVKLVVKTSPCLGNGGGVAQHAHGTLDLGQVTSWDDGGWLVVDTDLETGWAPVDELDRALGLDRGDGRVDVLGDDVTTVQHTAGHVLSVTGVALHHLVCWLEAHVGDLGNRQLLVVRLFGRDDRRVGGKREVDTRVRHQVSLELGKINVQGTIEAERCGDRGHDLGNESVQVGVCRALDVEVTAADVVDGLVVNHERAVGVLKGSVARQNGVVWLNNGGGDLRGWVDSEFKLRLLAVVDGQALHQKRRETRSSSSSEGVEDQESLKTGALVGELADAVQDEVNDLLTDGVVTTGVVVGGIFLTGDELFWVEQLAVRASADFVNDGWFEVNENATWDVLSGSGFGEEGVERVVTSSDGLVRRHLTVWGNSVLQAVQFPTGVTDLATGLADVD
eukprot:m.111310 g.111310  ORF g.111310 m.111310 type:complete len:468 (-) comp17006_c0_seq1:106-1509(-)